MELHSFDLQNQDINPGLITTLFEYGVSCLSDILLVFVPGHRFSNTDSYHRRDIPDFY